MNFSRLAVDAYIRSTFNHYRLARMAKTNLSAELFFDCLSNSFGISIVPF